MDRYAGLEPKFLQDFTDEERRAYVDANAGALRALLPADVVFTNHVLMGGPVGAATGVPFRVKAHGSELEYSMRGRPELQTWGREALAHAEATFVGSQHIRTVLHDVVGQVERVFEVPPGVDVDSFELQERDAALAGLIRAAEEDVPEAGNERLPDDGNARRLEAFLRDEGPTVLYFGKLIEQKGVQVLLEAMRDVDARLVVVGFGPYRQTLEAMAPPRTLFTGPLEHRPVPAAARGDGPAAPALHGPARARAPDASAAAGRRDGGALDLPGGVRDGRRRGSRGRLPAARRTSFRAGRGRGRPGRGVPRAPPPSRVVRDRRRCGPLEQAARAARALAGRPRRAAPRGPQRGRRAMVVVERRRAPPRAGLSRSTRLRSQGWATNRRSPGRSSFRPPAPSSTPAQISRSPWRRSSRFWTRRRWS